MLRKPLASLLVLFWVFSVGIDLVEDFDLGVYSEIHIARKPALPSLGETTQSSSDDFKNGNRTSVAQIKPASPPAPQSLAWEPVGSETRAPKNNLKIYKLHSAFLI